MAFYCHRKSVGMTRRYLNYNCGWRYAGGFLTQFQFSIVIKIKSNFFTIMITSKKNFFTQDLVCHILTLQSEKTFPLPPLPFLAVDTNFFVVLDSNILFCLHQCLHSPVSIFTNSIFWRNLFFFSYFLLQIINNCRKSKTNFVQQICISTFLLFITNTHARTHVHKIPYCVWEFEVSCCERQCQYELLMF